MLQRLATFFLGDIAPTSHAEKWISGLGALLGIAGVFGISILFLPAREVPLILASMGASAVLLFAVPHSALSQPWPLLGGHLVSCAIGITCARTLGDPAVAGAFAVAIAITVMYYLRCLHPPGGATALLAVLGGPEMQALGYQLLVTPVAINVFALLLLAIAFNALFPWRRYPLALTQRITPDDSTPVETETESIGVSNEDIAWALTKIKSYVDISEQDLANIYALALHHSESDRMPPDRIRIGGYYSNGRYGSEWAVRNVVDESGVSTPGKDKVIFRVIAGKDRRSMNTCTRAEFARWAKYEVERHENSWQRKSSDSTLPRAQ